MSERKRNRFLAFMISLPLVFVLLFFGYLPPQFDVVVYTDNIKGEGSCSAYLSSTGQTFAYLYSANAYFGSELKTLRMKDLRFDINAVTLYLYGVEEADILSYDIGVFGLAVLHHNSEGDQTILRPLAEEAVSSSETPIAHIINEEHLESFEVNFVKAIGIPLWVWIVYFALILLLSFLMASGIALLFERAPGLRRPLIAASVLFVTMIMGSFFCGSLPYVDYTDFLLNWILLYATSLLLGALSLPWIGAAAVSLFTLIWYIANYYVIKFRNKPIMPADLRAAGTAREVVGGYDLSPTLPMIVGIIAVLLYLAVMIVLWTRTERKEKKPLKKQLSLRIATLAVAVLLIIFGVNNPAFSALNEFQWDAKVLEGFHREGIVLTYVKSAISAHVAKPEGYSQAKVEEFLKEYQAKTEPEKDAVHPTRIIMIMNEAFSDLRVVGLDEQIDVMPFIDSLKENTVQGSLFVSVLGGGTCNTEFEALTGNSLAFLGSGAYPYTENITKPLFSLASYFRDNGYFTEAFHANVAHNWNRDMVYPNLGFKEFYSIERYPALSDEDHLHLYVSDRTDYRQIESEDAQYAQESRFLFNVTIQNHADYDHFNDVQEAESVSEFGGDLHQNARVYLSLIKASDDAIRELVETYRNSSEPTMIIFFGDHQPYLGGEAQEQVYAKLYSFLDYFRTKFFIWTNYETDPIYNIGISANFLPWLILERGNFTLPPYAQMLKEVYEKYPIISSQGVVDAEGNVFDNVAEVLDDPLIQKYQNIQYANLFDEIDPGWFEVE